MPRDTAGRRALATSVRDPPHCCVPRWRSGRASASNAIVAGETDPRLPEPVDLLFLSDTLHHLPEQGSYVKQFAKLLRPGGRVAIIEFAEGHWPAGHESFTIAAVPLTARGRPS